MKKDNVSGFFRKSITSFNPESGSTNEALELECTATGGKGDESTPRRESAYNAQRGSDPNSGNGISVITLDTGFRTGNGIKVNETEEKLSLDEKKDYINFGEEDQMEIQGYQLAPFRTFLTWTFIFLTVGILRLVFHWWPQLMLYATHRPCSIAAAVKILVTEHYQKKYKRYHVKPVFMLSADLFKTAPLFAAAGTPAPTTTTTAPASTQDHTHAHTESRTNWDQQLQEQLQSMDSPKLAIPSSTGSIRETSKIRVFSCKKLRYIWDEDQNTFVRLQGFDQVLTHDLHLCQGLSIFQQCQRRLIYGNNEIHVEVQSIVKLLFMEVLNPFYVFQILAFALWLSDNYYYYCTAIMIMSIFGITSSIIQTRQNQKKLKTTVQSSDIVTVSRGGGEYESIPTEYLVPGDVIVIPPHGCTMHCDAALLVGNCIVNESMLTGESVPVTKIPLPNRNDVTYNSKEHARHTLFCGTTIMQTRYYGNERVLAVVLRSGFLTAKGSLVRSIMYPPPVDYKFENDSYKFVAVLACIASIGFVNSIYMKLAQGESVRNIIVDSLDLFTIVVPPALPAAMTIGRFYAQRRLQKKGIYCISPRAINVSGSIDCVCFDKTGTLTEEGLDLWGAVPLKEMSSGTKRRPVFDSPAREAAHLSQGSLVVGMAACHSLTRIDDALIGDPLDLKMFEWVGWILEEPGVADNEKFDMIAPTIVRPRLREVNDNLPADKQDQVDTEVGIVRQFPFSSSLQRMAVITRTLGDSEYELYAKGSPEMITSLSVPESVPSNFSSTLERYTQEGYRVIAVGHKRLPKLNYAKVQRVVREEVETDLTFLGLIVMENRLKPETTGVMTVLKKAAIRTIMVTGDNLLTAISVAKECEMLETSDKVIVLSTESEGVDKVPKLHYSVADKVSPMASPSNSSSSPVISILNGAGATLDQDLISIKHRLESPSNRYHFALTGTVFTTIKTFYPELLPKILVRGTVFARMSPEQKQQLVEMLQGLGYFVGMCGDGANDCGALKAAHAGISLSDTESSVASPFTSKEANIQCIPHLIREGRGALVTSFAIFKYMAVYSLTQFISVILLYTIGSNLADLQFLYIDLFLITFFAFFFGNAEPSPGPLVKKAPSASLVSVPPICSILCHVTVILGVQYLAFDYVKRQPWFTAYVPVDNEYGSFENYTVFAVSSFQYIVIAIVFSKGRPYRKSIFYNPGLIISILLMTTITVYLVLYPAQFLIDNLELVLPNDMNFQLTLLGFAFGHFLLALFIENAIVDWLLTKQLTKFRQSRNKHNKKLEYLGIEYDLSRRTDWPPVSSSLPRVVNESEVTPRNTITRSDSDTRHVKSMSLSIPPPPEHPHHQPTSPERLSSSLTSSFSRPRPRSRHSSYSSSVEQNNIQNQFGAHSPPPADIPM